MTTLYYCFRGCAAAAVCFIGEFYGKRRPTLVVINLILKMTRGKRLIAMKKNSIVKDRAKGITQEAVA